MSNKHTSTALSNGPVILKKLIDLEDYMKLMKLNEECQKQNKQITEDSKLPQKVDTEKSEVENPEHAEIPNEQIGEGYTNNLEENMISYIDHKIHSCLQKVLASTSSGNQIGGGDATDLAPGPPLMLKVNIDPPEAGHVDTTKELPNTENVLTPTTEKDIDLIKTVGSKVKVKAEKLLNELKLHSDLITWDSTGLVSIKRTVIPGSNIKLIFPNLFRKVYSKKVPGLLDVATMVLSLGHGHLISPHLKINSRTTKTVLKDPNFFKTMKPAFRWYYIG